jgi:catechol 2,3-dioxygenase-like lactoylglutathione lyase family enzyme
MSAYDLDTRRLYAREYAERLKRDAQPPSQPRRRRRLRLRLLRELTLLSARRRAVPLRPSSSRWADRRRGDAPEDAIPGRVALLQAYDRCVTFLRTEYVIAVHDLERTARFYRDTLGFEVEELAPGWRRLARDACVIMAGECRDALPPADLGDHSYFAYVEVDRIDELHDAVRAAGVELVKPLRVEPWGMREFGIRTVDGHRMMFGAVANPEMHGQ